MELDGDDMVPLDIARTEHIQDDGSLIVTASQDVEPFLDNAKRLSNEGFQKTAGGDYHAASFPPVLVEKYCNGNKITFAEWLANGEHARRMLMDPALAHFRIWKGAVGRH